MSVSLLKKRWRSILDEDFNIKVSSISPTKLSDIWPFKLSKMNIGINSRILFIHLHAGMSNSPRKLASLYAFSFKIVIIINLLHFILNIFVYSLCSHDGMTAKIFAKCSPLNQIRNTTEIIISKCKILNALGEKLIYFNIKSVVRQIFSL